MASARGRRQQVGYARSRGISARRACQIVGTARSGLKLESKREKADAPILARMRELAAQYPRYGYRFIESSSSAKSRDERRPRLSIVAHGGPAGAAQTSA